MHTRRTFLARNGIALLTLGFAPSFLARTVFAAGAPRRAKQLVVVFQRGAVDGLSMVVPYGDASYYAARPSIAVPAPTGHEPLRALDLDGFFGLHPGLAALHPIWQRRDLAVVHACGSPDATRSHFDAQDYMETATPGVKRTEDGWLNRYLQTRQGGQTGAFQAVAVTTSLPRALQGRAPAVAMQQLSQFGLHTARPGLSASFESQYAEAADRLLHNVGREAFDAMKALDAADPGRYAPDHGANYPTSPFGRALAQVAQLLKADVGLEVAFTEVGGWDTHVNQGGAQGPLAARLSDFGQGLAAFSTDLGDRLADVVVLTMSEFGRAVAENGSRGTDHGHGNAMFVFGGGVKGGRIYGRWPGLAGHERYDGRDLAVTTDFRNVFAEVVVRHLGLPDAHAVFPGFSVDPGRFLGLFS